MEPLEEMENERIRWNWIRFRPKSRFVSTKKIKNKNCAAPIFFSASKIREILEKKEKSDYLAPLPLKNAPKALDWID